MKTICSFCHNECSFNIVNEGIGHYEYWGASGYDEHLVVVSTCCKEHCLDKYGNEITVSKAKELIAERNHYDF